MMTNSNDQRRTYCVLTVLVIVSLQINLIISLPIQMLRFSFVFLGEHYHNVIIVRNYWVYYSYQVLNLILIYSMDMVFTMQIYEWMAMINIILVQKDLSLGQMHFILANH